MATKITKRGTCAQCAATDVDLTVEHVFPEAWYPDEYPPSQMLTAPSCLPCNRRLGNSERRLFLPLALCLPTDERIASMVERASRGVDVNAARNERDATHRRNLGEALMRRVSVCDLNDRDGALWIPQEHRPVTVEAEDGTRAMGRITVQLPPDDLELVAIKLLRGCYFDRVGTPLPANAECWATSFDADPREVLAEWHQAPGVTPGGAYPFEYWLACIPERHRAGATLVLWDSVYLFAAANLPRSRAA